MWVPGRYSIHFLAHIISFKFPDRAKFLTEKERAQLLEILRVDAKGTPKSFQWKYLVAALTDWKVYVLVTIYLG